LCFGDGERKQRKGLHKLVHRSAKQTMAFFLTRHVRDYSRELFLGSGILRLFFQSKIQEKFKQSESKEMQSREKMYIVINKVCCLIIQVTLHKAIIDQAQNSEKS
jgi:dsRNA-specific ribonuclease